MRLVDLRDAPWRLQHSLEGCDGLVQVRSHVLHGLEQRTAHAGVAALVTQAFHGVEDCFASALEIARASGESRRRSHQVGECELIRRALREALFAAGHDSCPILPQSILPRPASSSRSFASEKGWLPRKPR